jgi:hypothetical protein
MKSRSRIFNTEDQVVFAKLSGDNNPLHIDPVAARKSLFGSAVVHGIHTLLWGLDCVLEGEHEKVEVQSIRAVFPKPLKVGEEVFLSSSNEADGRVFIFLKSGGSILTTLEVKLNSFSHKGFEGIKPCFPKMTLPRDLSDTEIESDSGTLDLCLDAGLATKLFPNLMRCISPLQSSVILSTTRLVGVRCPGLHSLYSELCLSKTKPNENTALNYKVTKFDKRFGLVLMNINAPDMTGTIEAFRRTAPLKQANYLTLKSRVKSNEFSGQRAIIIGGSRGLGEVTAKLLAAGAADVKVTFNQGRIEADSIVGDITSNGGVADSFHFDVLNPKNDFSNILKNNWIPTHLYYFATPFIFSGVKGVFSPQLYNKFCGFYCDGFVNIINQLREFGVKRIFCPSTVAINELPTNMAEYTVAKTASEVICTFLEKADRELIIHKPRFPRVATDQTLSIMPVNNRDPVPIMLDELRIFRDRNIKT